MRGYVLTTPVRDELDNLPALVASIEAQTVRPTVWLVVDDGSTDGSRAWLADAAAERPWMHVADSPEANTEYLGAHIARIKRWGLEEARRLAGDGDGDGDNGDNGDNGGGDLVAAGVLDADILLPADHYEILLAALDADPKLGVVSSVIESRGPDGVVQTERLQRTDLPRGGTQFFRLACLDAIGGLPPWPGFDGAANAKARLAGWRCRLLTHLVATQQRPTASRFGAAAGYARKGRYAWFLGLHPALVLARTASYSLRPPHAAGAYFLKAWAGQAVRREPRCPDPEVRRYYGRERLREYVGSVVGRGPDFAK